MSAVSGYADLLEAAGLRPDAEVEVQTDKEKRKAVPCVVCGKPLVVSAFAIPASARCGACKSAPRARETVGVVRPGVTDPAKARNLADCLVNPAFGFARCPVHPDDPDHFMTLKSVTHSDRYGPSRLTGYDKGQPVYVQTAIGESVMHQCDACKATVSYSTMPQAQYRAQNEPRTQVGDPTASWSQMLGVRDA